MPSPKLVVIGGGLAGLSAGVYAASNGYRVTVLERHSLPGGACTAWTREGYTFDGAVHWLLGAKPGRSIHRMYQETGALRHVELVPAELLTVLTDTASGAELSITRDLRKLADDVRALSPADAGLVDTLVVMAEKLRGFDIPLDQTGPASWRTWLEKRNEVFTLMTRRDRVSSWAERAHHPLIKRGLFGIAGGRLPATFLALLLGSLAEGSVARLRGNSKGLSRGVAGKLDALGGDLRVDTEVDEILVENGRAVGVRLADGSTLEADRVVSAAPAHVTWSRLLRGHSGNRVPASSAIPTTSDGGSVLVSFAVSRTWPHAPLARKLLLDAPMELGGIDVSSIRVRHSGYDPALAPKGGCVLQVLLPGSFEYWTHLSNDREVYQVAKDVLARKLVGLLERWYPMLDDNLVTTDVATPLSFWRFTRAHRGAYDGWLPRVETWHFDRPKKTVPGIERLHLCGQWVEPGGGVPTVLASGREVVQQICKADGWAFEPPTLRGR